MVWHEVLRRWWDLTLTSFCRSTSARCWSNTSTTAAWPQYDALMSDEYPRYNNNATIRVQACRKRSQWRTLSCKSICASNWSNALTIETWPDSEALISALRPSYNNHTQRRLRKRLRDWFSLILCFANQRVLCSSTTVWPQRHDHMLKPSSMLSNHSAARSKKT